MSDRPPYFDSQEQAAQSLGVPVATLRAAKAAGCSAFRSGRVYREPLEEWLRAKSSDENATPDDERTLRLEERRLKLERERYELEKAREEMVPVAEVEAALGKMLAQFRQSLDALPGRIAGGIDQADANELLKLLNRAKADGLTVTQLIKLVKTGDFRFADFHARRAFVESEVEVVKRTLTQCEYMQTEGDGEPE